MTLTCLTRNNLNSFQRLEHPIDPCTLITFSLHFKSNLGDLSYLNIWHDNAGEGSKAYWFLKYVVIKDFQTQEKFYFICQRWLSIEHDDGLIERLLPVCGLAQKTQFTYLLQKQALYNLRDGHLWFSIFVKPLQSSFTRMDRATNAFVLLAMNMMVNIIYYDMAKSPPSEGLQIGPFNFTPQQCGIAIMTSLIVVPPSMILVNLFRRSRRRFKKLAQIKKILDMGKSDEELAREKELQKQMMKKRRAKKAKNAQAKKKPLTFPW